MKEGLVMENNQLTIEERVWNKVMLARHPKRPTAKILIDYLIDDFIECHGDRLFSDDAAFITGIGYLNKQPITVIAEEKGSNTQDKLIRNFGMPHPEGYRKALRMMKQAEKFSRPILFIIDTPGAYPGLGAEERGQASAIATNLKEMISLKVPLIAVVLSEGGSGGALAIGVSDEVWMFENSIYSILSPEGFASILYKDSSLAKKAASIMKLTADDLRQFGIVDDIIPEDVEGLHKDPFYSFKLLKERLHKKFKLLKQESPSDRVHKRYLKYRELGDFHEG
jgi:acetyl-CoA carboxylase carboxyl transferase subunit alpha